MTERGRLLHKRPGTPPILSIIQTNEFRTLHVLKPVLNKRYIRACEMGQPGRCVGTRCQASLRGHAWAGFIKTTTKVYALFV